MKITNTYIRLLNHNRNYNPGHGRFMSEDPILFNKDEYNSYKYTYNNPFKFKDSSGEGPVALAFCSAAVVSSTQLAFREVENEREDIDTRIETTKELIEKEILKYKNNAFQEERYSCPPEDRKEKISHLNKRLDYLKKLKAYSDRKIKKIKNDVFRRNFLILGMCALPLLP